MLIQSQMKKSLGEDLMKKCAGVCYCRKYSSSQEKMEVILRLLKKFNVSFTVTGGATNRLVALIDGYNYKFAVDDQGLYDNMVEYSISRELQPYVTRTYETNGYILVSEYVSQVTPEIWKARKNDFLRILGTLATEGYLLGDVGYTGKNYTNWGYRDDNSLVILDYGYCHRGTINLFNCSKCGGVLTYDANYTKLVCANRGAGCNATYDYNAIRVKEGKQIDYDTIDEAKTCFSIELKKGVMSVEVDESPEEDGLLVNPDEIEVIHNQYEYGEYLRKEKKRVFREECERKEDAQKLIEITQARESGNEERARILEERLKETIAKRDTKPAKRLIFANSFYEQLEREEKSEINPEFFYGANSDYQYNLVNLGILTPEEGQERIKECKERREMLAKQIEEEEEMMRNIYSNNNVQTYESNTDNSNTFEENYNEYVDPYEYDDELQEIKDWKYVVLDRKAYYNYWDTIEAIHERGDVVGPELRGGDYYLLEHGIIRELYDYEIIKTIAEDGRKVYRYRVTNDDVDWEYYDMMGLNPPPIELYSWYDREVEEDDNYEPQAEDNESLEDESVSESEEVDCDEATEDEATDYDAESSDEYEESIDDDQNECADEPEKERIPEFELYKLFVEAHQEEFHKWLLDNFEVEEEDITESDTDNHLPVDDSKPIPEDKEPIEDSTVETNEISKTQSSTMKIGFAPSDPKPKEDEHETVYKDPEEFTGQGLLDKAKELFSPTRSSMAIVVDGELMT